MERLGGSATVIEATADGNPVVMRSGNRAYLGGWPDDETLVRILRDRCAELAIATVDLPDGLRLRDTATHRFAMNYAPEPLTIDGRTVPAAGVLWWPRD